MSSIKYQGEKVHLGIYNTELEAAQAYDRAAIRCSGTKAFTNFDVNEYKDELAEFEDCTRNNHALLDPEVLRKDILKTRKTSTSKSAAKTKEQNVHFEVQMQHDELQGKPRNAEAHNTSAEEKKALQKQLDDNLQADHDYFTH